MNRAEHMQWCKQRAMEYVQRGEPLPMVARLIADTPETADKHYGKYQQDDMRALLNRRSA